jgi:hypothetical protein
LIAAVDGGSFGWNCRGRRVVCCCRCCNKDELKVKSGKLKVKKIAM